MDATLQYREARMIAAEARMTELEARMFGTVNGRRQRRTRSQGRALGQAWRKAIDVYGREREAWAATILGGLAA